MLDGEFLRYYSNGQLMYKLQYVNDKQHGEQLYYYENGELRTKENYISGK